MAVQNFRKMFVYRYKLVENYYVNITQVAGVSLTKEFKDFKNMQESLLPFIKSPSNPNGFIDFEKKDLISNEIIQQSTYTGKIPDIIAREVLNAMERYELVPIAKYYNIDCVQKDSKMLVKLIIEYQNKRIEAELKEQKNSDNEIKTEEEEKNKEENITNNKIENQNKSSFFTGFGFGIK